MFTEKQLRKFKIDAEKASGKNITIDQSSRLGTLGDVEVLTISAYLNGAEYSNLVATQCGQAPDGQTLFIFEINEWPNSDPVPFGTISAALIAGFLSERTV